MTETFEVGLFASVNIEVVGIGAGDDRSPGLEPVERTVKLVGFDNHVVTLFTEDVIRSVVLCDATEESVAVDVALVKQVGRHGRGCGLAVSSGYAQPFIGLG